MTANLPFFLGHIWLIPMFPLATAAVMLFAGRFLQLLSLPQGSRQVFNVLFEWIPAVPYHMLDGRMARFVADWGFQLDPLSAVMILIVTGVGFLIHMYATGYMAHE